MTCGRATASATADLATSERSLPILSPASSPTHSTPPPPPSPPTPPPTFPPASSLTTNTASQRRRLRVRAPTRTMTRIPARRHSETVAIADSQTSSHTYAPAALSHQLHMPSHSRSPPLSPINPMPRPASRSTTRAIFIYSLASSRSHHRHRRRGSFSSTRRDSASSTTIERQRSHSMRLIVSGWKTCVRL